MEKATEKQLNYLKGLGAAEKELEALDKLQASKLIKKYLSLKYGNKKQKAKAKKLIEKVAEREHSLKVGDILYASWGYDQTNIDLFVVTELVGKQSVRIKACDLKVKREEATCTMARNVSFDTSDYAIAERSVFIDDKEQKGNGALKRVLGEKESPYIKLSSFAHAYKYNGGELYESWYA